MKKIYEKCYVNISDLVAKTRQNVILTEDFERAIFECMIGLENSRINNIFICTDSVFFQNQIPTYLAMKLRENLSEYVVIKLQPVVDLFDENLSEILNEVISSKVSKVVLYIENFDMRIAQDDIFVFFNNIKLIKEDLNLEELRILGTIKTNGDLSTDVDSFYEKEFQYTAISLIEPNIIEYNNLFKNVIDNYFNSIEFSEKMREKFLYMFNALRLLSAQKMNDYLADINYLYALCKFEGAEKVEEKHIKKTFALDSNLIEKPSKKSLKKTTIHEAGHIVVGMIAFKKNFDVRFVTNYQDLYMADGKTYGIIKELSMAENMKVLKKYLAYTLAGMAAYDFMGISFDNGSDEDLKDATENAKKWLMTVGANKKIGLQYFRKKQKISNQKLKIIEDETEKLLKEAYNYALKIIKENKEFFYIIIKKLNKNRILTKKEIEKIYKKVYKH